MYPQEVEALIRPASSNKPPVLNLKYRGVKIHVAEIEDAAQLVRILTGIDTVISAIGPGAVFDQIPLANAAKKAGVKRFVPCAFITVCPPGGVMWIRDQVLISAVTSDTIIDAEQKEEIYQHIRKIAVPYTIIDRWIMPVC
jgi:hypothetical protein